MSISGRRWYSADSANFPDEVHHRKMLAEPFVAILHARDFIFNADKIWELEIRLAVNNLLCQKALEVHLEAVEAERRKLCQSKQPQQK